MRCIWSISVSERYRIVQDRLFESDFDRVVAETKQLASDGPSAPPPKPRKGKKS